MIKNPEHFLNSQWNWDIFQDCFPGKIRPSDVDGIVAHNGEVLIIETKHIRGSEKLPYGQWKVMDTLRKKGCYVIIIWGKKDNPEKYRILSKNGITDIRPCNLETIQMIVRKWFEHADRKPVE